jgi:LmbE family N-acetylglucosaminyl deacetylase
VRSPPVALAVSPHPDDELLGAPATLMALRDAGWRIVNLVCSLGRQPQRSRRRADLEEACRAARFELTIPEALPPLGHDDDLESGGEALREVIAEAIDALAPPVIVAPSPHDCHHAHEVVGRALRDAVEADTAARNVMFWGLWGDLPVPNVLIPFGAARLGEIERALAAHRGELERNRYDRLLAGRATAQAVSAAPGSPSRTPRSSPTSVSAPPEAGG